MTVESEETYSTGCKAQHTQKICISWSLSFKWRALISTARGAEYLDQPPRFVPGRVRAAAQGSAQPADLQGWPGGVCGAARSRCLGPGWTPQQSQA